MEAFFSSSVVLVVLSDFSNLRRLCNKHSGVSFNAKRWIDYHYFSRLTVQDSLYKTLLRSYLPTAVALAIGISWGAINLDVLRTEPYVLLARTEGAQASVLFDTNLTNLFRVFWITTKSLVATCSRTRSSAYTIVPFHNHCRLCHITHHSTSIAI